MSPLRELASQASQGCHPTCENESEKGLKLYSSPCVFPSDMDNGERTKTLVRQKRQEAGDLLLPKVPGVSMSCKLEGGQSRCLQSRSLRPFPVLSAQFHLPLIGSRCLSRSFQSDHIDHLPSIIAHSHRSEASQFIQCLFKSFYSFDSIQKLRLRSSNGGS